ncbi:hypothetical protein [Actinomadura rugatobispora]|uniref:Uncharacterized protein n=1 Tax=Actinomadura rugatobispora TaxID=1994 RepID=A0ABW1A2M0_9ACTN|nr:hypothetical protein GCM10010200_007320 [Actinomadura rugatobispora]
MPERRWFLRPAYVPVMMLVLSLLAAVVVVEWRGEGAYGEPKPRDTALLEARAREVISAWQARHPVAKRTFVPVRPRTVPPVVGTSVLYGRDPSVQRQEEIGRAVRSGHLRVAPRAVTDVLPERQPVLWEDGFSLDVPVVSAADAISTARSSFCESQDCGVPALEVTGARLRSAPMETAHGRASVPVWMLDLEGTPVRLALKATDPRLEPEALKPRFQPGGGVYAPVSRVEAPTQGSSMTVQYIGAPPGEGPCSAEYRARVVEGETAVVAIVQARPRREPVEGVACAPAGTLRREVISLSRPLGERVVLDLAQGLPVPVIG